MIKSVLVIFFSFIVCSVYGYSTGAPKEACDDMKPQHPYDPKTTKFPYNVTISKLDAQQGETLLVRVAGGMEPQFKGFLVQIRDKNGPVGSFSIPSSNKLAQTLDCGSKTNAVTHTSADLKDAVEFDWTAPSNYKGKLTLFASVAKDGAVFWAKQEANSIQVS
ncbi:hypothetical protein PPYR_01258 [Photinus pyralis]|uniref:Reelin domain-containing protein n=1 Tax=Photinus pyralis TaxID=7054 RepID=A0A1Y1KNL8_PHOPY|nr:putative defense protein Hdd11 [Photinus pyralis]KAB0804288.1 hypothetical protein PPYR_01258 [Photinus pyralis]